MNHSKPSLSIEVMSTSSAFQVTEPHPSVPRSHCLYSGRGGAGNFSHVDPTSVTDSANATGPASRVPLPARSAASVWIGGRGGAGNAHRQKERAIFSFDEELQLQRKLNEEKAPVYHIGRGGAGNTIESNASADRDDAASTTSSRSGTKARRSGESGWGRISKTFTRQ